MDFAEYEIVPEQIPEHETPRELLLRMTGYDFTSLSLFGRDITWQEMREVDPDLKWMAHILAVASKPRPIILRKKDML